MLYRNMHLKKCYWKLQTILRSHDNILPGKSVVSVLENDYLIVGSVDVRESNNTEYVMSAVNQFREPLLDDSDVN